MAHLRRLLPILLLALTLSACGGGSGSKQAGPSFAGASSRTVASGTAAFTLLIGASVGGTPVRSGET
jgi:hypothetical protein